MNLLTFTAIFLATVLPIPAHAVGTSHSAHSALLERVNTRFGVVHAEKRVDSDTDFELYVESDKVLTYEGYGIFLAGPYLAHQSTFVLVFEATGGTGCPGFFRVLELGTGGHRFLSETFGTCSDLFEFRFVGHTPEISVPNFCPTSTYDRRRSNKRGRAAWLYIVGVQARSRRFRGLCREAQQTVQEGRTRCAGAPLNLVLGLQNMTSPIRSLSEAGLHLVSAISESEAQELQSLFPFARVSKSRAWLDRIVASYLCGPFAADLINDIDARHPDLAVLKDIRSDAPGPMWEAEMIFMEAKRLLQERAEHQIESAQQGVQGPTSPPSAGPRP